MATRRRSEPAPQPHDLYQLLLFPQRAEYLEQDRFKRYSVHLEHWRELSLEFRRAFESVYTNGSACILLVHGPQATGKTLFARRIEDDFNEVRNRKGASVNENLWLALTGGDPVDLSTSELAANTSALRRVEPEPNWLKAEREFAKSDQHAMRVFIIDDVHRDVFLREWAELSQGEYLRLKADHLDAVALEAVAQRLVDDCRGHFQRSLFVLLSNNTALLAKLHAEIERWHAGLCRILELPLPEPTLKEKIVRTNTNRLNRRSYWYCLDRGGPTEKRQAYQSLREGGGFLDAFKAIDRALQADSSSRLGRPANKNLLTLVTLGSDPLTIQSYIGDRELRPDHEDLGRHLGAWLFRQQWASALSAGDDAYARRAELLESEFTLRWVTLDMRAVFRLIEGSQEDRSCARLVDFMRMRPSIGDSAAVKGQARRELEQLDDELDDVAGMATFDAFEQRFRASGMGRSAGYEQVLAQRFGQQLSRGLVEFPSVRPDIILGQYEPCAVTSSPSDDSKAIEQAIRRTCHVIEFTSYLQPDLRGLDSYLRDKVGVYATLLESV